MAIEDQRRISQEPELTEEAWEEVVSEDATQIASILAESLPAPHTDIAMSNPFTAASFDPSLINLSMLTSLQHADQMKQAEMGIRGSQKSITNSSDDTTLPTCQKILCKFHAVIKAQEEMGVASGRDGIIEGQMINSAPNGNSTNAVVTVTAAATKLLKHCQKIINDFKLPTPLQTAGMSAVYPLHIGDWSSVSGYGFILVEGEIMIGRALSIYSKSSGKGTQYAWVSNTSSIMAVSNIVMQIYKHVVGAQFQAIHSGQKLYMKHFTLIKLGEFLCALSMAPPAVETGLRLTEET
ncbi:hypothetical protein AX14_008144 [Amanita brunnescens Koide BX004]|nr:hypothetical protein AX14_008144 [Amanita brunnescens Koide BX004]